MGIHIDNIHLWFESKTVLIYMNFRPYIMRRCYQIRQNTNLEDWKYISTDLNIADVLPCGIILENLDVLLSWFAGQNFIKDDSLVFNGKNTNEIAAVNRYQKLVVYPFDVKPAPPNTSRPTIFWKYYSSWNNIKGQLVWIVKVKN